MQYLVISSSLNPDSQSRILADTARNMLEEKGEKVDWIDLQDITLPLCGFAEYQNNENVLEVRTRIQAARGILLASPVYNFDANAAAKNLIELTGPAWKEKIVGFLLSAGGQGSYMSIMGLANSLMLDFRVTIIPRFVYATKEAIKDDKVNDENIRERIKELANSLCHYTKSLKGKG